MKEEHLISPAFKLNHLVFELKEEDEVTTERLHAAYTLGCDIVLQFYITKEDGIVCRKGRTRTLIH
jgi:hypothetical protein